ncbi:MAG: division/cell wall cluster transcriptional repressor MraZ [Clostridia bacterium]|nr:division/cell wall cluster transcriptional repressor MraZ [Clostridia bacterium]
MFSGRAYHNIDAKGRIFIPAMYRTELGDKFVVANGFSDPYLVIYPMSEWEELIEKIDALGMDKNARAIKRYIMMNANPTEMDSQGRIVLSKEHREFAKLTKEALILGMNRTIEIWDSADITEQTKDAPENLEEFLTQLH